MTYKRANFRHTHGYDHGCSERCGITYYQRRYQEHVALDGPSYYHIIRLDANDDWRGACLHAQQQEAHRYYIEGCSTPVKHYFYTKAFPTTSQRHDPWDDYTPRRVRLARTYPAITSLIGDAFVELATTTHPHLTLGVTAMLTPLDPIADPITREQLDEKVLEELSTKCAEQHGYEEDDDYDDEEEDDFEDDEWLSEDEDDDDDYDDEEEE